MLDAVRRKRWNPCRKSAPASAGNREEKLAAGPWGRKKILGVPGRNRKFGRGHFPFPATHATGPATGCCNGHHRQGCRLADPPMNPLHDYLLNTGRADFPWRARLLKYAATLPAKARKQAFYAIWSGRVRHMRGLDLDYSFERREWGLAAMRFQGQVVVSSVPVVELVGRITRPVTLVAAGPSALTYDWETLRQSGRMIVVVSGGASFLRERGIMPDLLVVSDPRFCPTGGYHIRDAEGIPLAMDYRCAAALHACYPDSFRNRRIALLERVNRWYGVPALPQAGLERLNEAAGRPFHFYQPQANPNIVGWSERTNCGFFPSATVAFVALQILVELGAAEIDIVGMDLGGSSRSIYADSQPNRFQDQYAPVILPSFQLMRKVLAYRSIRIANLSPTCPLPADLFQPGDPVNRVADAPR